MSTFTKKLEEHSEFSGTVPGAIDCTADSDAQTIPKIQRRLVTAVHLLAIAFFALFLIWGLNGNTPLNGDDVGVIRRTMLSRHNMHYDYLDWTMNRLHVVGFLHQELLMFGGSMEKANLGWLAVYAASAFACYGFLRKLTNPLVALSGAVFYLCYSSKFEPFTWWSAGAYPFMWLTFFGLLTLLESKIRFSTKAVLITLITAGSMYLYEVFTAIIPVISLLLLWRRRKEIGELKFFDYLMSALPTLLLLVHLGILASCPKPIYKFEPSTATRFSMPVRVLTGFTSSVDATVGIKHKRDVRQAVTIYKEYFQNEGPSKLLLVAAVALCLIGMLVAFPLSLSNYYAPILVSVAEWSVLATATFLSAFIGFVSNLCTTPSRLTGLPSIGYMLFFCLGLQLAIAGFHTKQRWKRSVAVVAICLLSGTMLSISVREICAFRSILIQAEEVAAFDRAIAEKIHALHPTISKGDEIYVRIAYPAQWSVGRWRNLSTYFTNGHASDLLAYLYGVPIGDIKYSTSPYRRPGEKESMQFVVNSWAKTGTDKVIPFFVDQQGIVLPIKDVVLHSPDGASKKLDFARQFDSSTVFAPTQNIPVEALPPISGP
ncbi:MAG TPA: hypothetical protein V6C76_02240 [Drouetiella sp.]